MGAGSWPPEDSDVARGNVSYAALGTLLDLTEKDITATDQPDDADKHAKAESVAIDALEMMARRLGDDPHMHLRALIAVCGETLGRSASTHADLSIGADTLREKAFARGLVAMLRGRLEGLPGEELD